jgi:hypothetical protein
MNLLETFPAPEYVNSMFFARSEAGTVGSNPTQGMDV